MMEYKEEEYLMLSGLQHFEFCRRQWALIHIEQIWDENYLTIDGDIMHKKTHDAAIVEKRKNLLISRGMPIASATLGVSGTCDVVEFIQSEDGISIVGHQKKYKPYPVEYKRGKEKSNDSDVLQVVAQAMCLEEMLCCKIEKVFLYYGETRRRCEVVIEDSIREKVTRILAEMHQLYQAKHIPKVKMSKACKSCSLYNSCMPKNTKSATGYIERMLEGES